MTITTINAVEYVDFRARFVGLYSSGVFVFRVINEPGADPLERWNASRSLNDQEPPAGFFGLPEYDGDGICPRIHTVRLRLGWARARRIL